MRGGSARRRWGSGSLRPPSLRPFALPEGVELPKYQRGFVVRSDGSVQWYKKRRGGRDRRFVAVLTKAFLQLSPDSCWSLPDLREFLESGKAISDYV